MTVNAIDNALAGAAAADVALSEDRDPFIRALEYGILARRGLQGVINNRIRSHDKLIQDYYSNLKSGLSKAVFKLDEYDKLNTKMIGRNNMANFRTYKKQGINLEKASF
jgi:hypothetical protein